ncbi:Spy/CpxP family protein refolding chaperone [Phreatobacter sp.]|uniref:Spy/CpxP family protein refolding chaperone n=1 Tax=Phreatobacter sp. TaxID=1966341 RepID=UPI0022C5C471|nr:Spy/CpxP family protein refolding chaperone [Phreatobacter sp.]MCZ8313342.1 Spy/CpxP family protein refolding chaperone [Phreatobacter sp.]
MKTRIIAAGVVASMALAAAALAQPAPGPRGPGGPPGPDAAGPGADGPRGPGWRRMMNPEDRAAMTDARIAGLKAMLRLTPEQERHWPALETALREAAGQRDARMTERMQRWREMRENRDAARPDPVQRLRTAADRMAANAATMRKLADAAGPLYASLDEAQKRRVERVMERGGRMGWGPGMGMSGGMGGGWGGHGGHGGRGEGRGGEGGRL